MMHPEFKQTLHQPSMSLVRRSVRISRQDPIKHAIKDDRMWKVRNMESHKRNLLEILNSGNLKILQSLPGIGPKTAIVVHSHRELKGQFGGLDELGEIPGLHKNFYFKFCVKNQVV